MENKPCVISLPKLIKRVTAPLFELGPGRMTVSRGDTGKLVRKPCWGPQIATCNVERLEKSEKAYFSLSRERQIGMSPTGFKTGKPKGRRTLPESVMSERSPWAEP